MRRYGTSLKDTAARCEISRTTVIAPMKAYDTGGWKAVEVDRGGRPAGTALLREVFRCRGRCLASASKSCNGCHWIQASPVETSLASCAADHPWSLSHEGA